MGVLSIMSALRPSLKKRTTFLAGSGTASHSALGIYYQGGPNILTPLRVPLVNPAMSSNGYFMAMALSEGTAYGWGASEWRAIPTGTGPRNPWAGAWTPEIPYLKGHLVFVFNTGECWVSQQNENIGHEPFAGSAWWKSTEELSIQAPDLVAFTLSSTGERANVNEGEPEYGVAERSHAFPIECPELKGVKWISAPGENGAVIFNDGELCTWGNNNFGMLGTGWNQVNLKRTTRPSGLLWTAAPVNISATSKIIKNVKTSHNPLPVGGYSPPYGSILYTAEFTKGSNIVKSTGPFYEAQVGQLIKPKTKNLLPHNTTIARFISSTELEMSGTAAVTETLPQTRIYIALFAANTAYSKFGTPENKEGVDTYAEVEMAALPLLTINNVYLGILHNVTPTFWPNESTLRQFCNWPTRPLYPEGIKFKEVTGPTSGANASGILALEVGSGEGGEGRIWAWGANPADGMLGLNEGESAPTAAQTERAEKEGKPLPGQESFVLTPTLVPENWKEPGSLPLKNIMEVSSMQVASFALRKTGVSAFGNPVGEVLGWGSNTSNQLMHPASPINIGNCLYQSNPPKVLPGLGSGVRHIACNHYKGLAIIDGAEEGEVYAWGEVQNLGKYSGTATATTITKGSVELKEVWIPVKYALYVNDYMTDAVGCLGTKFGGTVQARTIELLAGKTRTTAEGEEKCYNIKTNGAAKESGTNVALQFINTMEVLTIKGNIVKVKTKWYLEVPAPWPNNVAPPLSSKSVLIDTAKVLQEGTYFKGITGLEERTNSKSEVEAYYLIELSKAPAGEAANDTIHYTWSIELFKPVRIGTIKNAFAIDCSACSIVLTKEGGVYKAYGWGPAGYGQLGDGTQQTKFTPVLLDWPEPIAISTGGFNTFATCLKPPPTSPVKAALNIEKQGEASVAPSVRVTIQAESGLTGWTLRYKISKDYFEEVLIQEQTSEIERIYEEFEGEPEHGIPSEGPGKWEGKPDENEVQGQAIIAELKAARAKGEKETTVTEKETTKFQVVAEVGGTYRILWTPPTPVTPEGTNYVATVRVGPTTYIIETANLWPLSAF